MRKILLALVLGVTTCNLAVGTYAAVCKSKAGARACGAECTGGADGGCRCSGGCSKEEMDWVTGGSAGFAELEEADVY